MYAEALDLKLPQPPKGANRLAVDALLEELDQAGLLTGRFRALGVTLQSTADAVDKGMAEPKVSVATTTLNKLLLDGISQLPEPRRVDSSDAYNTLDAVIAAMTAKALNGDTDNEPVY